MSGRTSAPRDQVRYTILIVAVFVLVCVLLITWTGPSCGCGHHKTDWGGLVTAPERPPPLTPDYPHSYTLADGEPSERLYHTVEVDPLITGQLYAGARAAGPGHRWIYGSRTAYGGKWGLREFSTGLPGQTGVDVGPLGLREYSPDGRPEVFDDGIPENWQMPSTPVDWYAPAGRDYYDVETQQVGVYDKHLLPLQEPDHDVLLN